MSIINGPVTYTMGSPSTEKYRTDDEFQHWVTIPRSFAISTKEVTVFQFQQFLEDNPLIKEAARKDSSKSPSIENKKLLAFSPESDCPQIYITWYEAAQYCNWLSKMDGIPESEWCYPEYPRPGMTILEDSVKRTGFRLPTEAEWEYFCRAGTDTDYSFGGEARQLGDFAWFADNAAKKTHPCGQKKPNPWGLYDMHGNVAEWCQDVYDKGYYKVSPEANPHGPAEGKDYVLRGGSWKSDAEALRSSHRLGDNPGFSDACLARDAIGFRCVRKNQ